MDLNTPNSEVAEEETKMYILQDVPGKGKGFIATRMIPRGTRILSEEPVIIIPEDAVNSQKLSTSVQKQVDALTPSQQEALLSMHNLYAHDGNSPYIGIIRTNALPLGDGEGGICLEACRINHACNNNAQKSWNENIKRHTVHAMRDIEKGEEITIYYLGIMSSRNSRQQALQKKFAFTCTCDLCSLPAEQSDERDRKLEEILKLDGLIGAGGLMGILESPLRVLRYVDRQVQLYNEQGPGDSGLPRAYLDAAQISIANGDLARGRIFAERAVLGWVILEGEDSPHVLQYKHVVKDPSKQALYGSSMKWRTSVTDVPEGLDPKDFEDWIWKRVKPKRPGQPADLRSHTTFPAFDELPHEKYSSPEFFVGTSRQPRRHWLFLAEIVDFTSMLRVKLDLKDVHDSTIPLWFYTQGRGSELQPSLVRKGYTAAILYPESHSFMSDEPGIRLEDSTKIKIFPLSLEKLLAVSDRVQSFSVDSKGLAKCHGCGKQAQSLKKCSKCSLFSYCDGTCQKVGWNENGHKDDCKILKDPDLKGMFLLDWDKFEGHFSFPLDA